MTGKDESLVPSSLKGGFAPSLFGVLSVMRQHYLQVQFKGIF